MFEWLWDRLAAVVLAAAVVSVAACGGSGGEQLATADDGRSNVAGGGQRDAESGAGAGAAESDDEEDADERHAGGGRMDDDDDEERDHHVGRGPKDDDDDDEDEKDEKEKKDKKDARDEDRDHERGGPRELIRVMVPAATGGVFSDDPAAPRITLSIPPGALSHDAVLRVRERRKAHRVGDLQTGASSEFVLHMRKHRGGKGRLVLSQPMKLEIAADLAPVHPELGEIALRRHGHWQRLAANFFKPSTQSVVALTDRTKGSFRVVFRRLQAVTGEAAERGREVFMAETFGNESFFGEVVGLHELLSQVSPSDAVALGVQVDVNRVPQEVLDVMSGTDLDAKDAALADPATTLALLRAGAVIGVKGVFGDQDQPELLTAAGITCALCHVTVTPTEFELNAGTLALPIGQPRFDGVPNAAMDAGAILALTPFAQAAGQDVVDLLDSWGPGRFDIRALPDNPLEDDVNNPTANPPIWNFVDLAEQGYAFGWDGLFLDDGINNNALASQAEAVYDLVMHANGAFGTAAGTLPPELSIDPPQALLDALAAAEADQPGNDIALAPLLDLQAWMRSITSPAPGDFDEVLAEQGFELFYGSAGCAGCHSSPEFTGPGLFADITAEPPQGGLAGGIHVPGLRGVRWTAPYFHDHSAPDLADVLDQLIDAGKAPALTDTEKAALVEYLNSL